MVVKRILCSERLRRIPQRFSWLDHRLVRDRYLCGVDHSSLALYLFLVTVSDAEGLSYYSDASVGRHLNMNPPLISHARAQLCSAGLVAYRKPMYQVLSLEKPVPPPNDGIESYDTVQPHRGESELVSIGDILRQAIGGTQ